MAVKKYRVWIIVGVVSLILVSLVWWSFSQTPMVARSSEAWSRGRIVGYTPVKRRTALAVALDNSVVMVWQNMSGRLELAHVGVDGEILLTRVLSVGTDESDNPQLQMGADGRLGLLWLEGEYPDTVVHYALLEMDGTLVGQPRVLSDPAIPVLDVPVLLSDPAGRYHAVWADDAGVRWTMLSAEGTPLAGPVLLSAEVRFPACQVDEQGRLHLIWQPQRERIHVEKIHYAVLDPQDVDGGVVEAMEVAEISLRSGQGLGKPIIGLSSEMGYAFWVIRDFEYIATAGEYVVFPLSSPRQGQVEPLRLWQGRYPEGLYASEGARTPLLLALSESVPDQKVEGVLRSQISVLALGQDGAREQVVTASVQASLKPALVVGDDSSMHLAWLEMTGFGRYRVVYASTAPEVMANYNALTLLDVLDVVFGNVFQLSTLTVALVVALIIWTIVPFLGLVIYYLVTSEETLDTLRSQGALIVALAFVVAFSFVQPLRIGVNVDWPALRWIAPLVAMIVATFVTLRVVRHRKYVHLFAAFFLFTILYSVLQTLVFLLL
jgi:hypothetical protein